MEARPYPLCWAKQACRVAYRYCASGGRASVLNPLHWNWWKVGFFVALLAFEITREIAVIEANAPQRVGVISRVSGFQGYVHAAGRWRRTDNGSELIPSATVIECWQDRGECTEVTAQTFDGLLMEPDVSLFDATFSDNSVSYINDLPGCVKYSVRIDLNMKEAFAVRDRKADPTMPDCELSESRVEMRLGDGYETGDSDIKKFRGDHFLPLLSGLWALAELF